MKIPQSTMIRLVGRLLQQSATEFQFPLAHVIPDVDQRRYLIAAVHETFPAALGSFDPTRTYETWSAWHLARYAATVCDSEVATFEAIELAATNGITLDKGVIDKLETSSANALSDAELLAYLGTDAQRWAHSCIDHAHNTDKADEGFLIGWFANAIEAGRAAGRVAAQVDELNERIHKRVMTALETVDQAPYPGPTMQRDTKIAHVSIEKVTDPDRVWTLPEGKTIEELNEQLAKDFAEPLPVYDAGGMLVVRKPPDMTVEQLENRVSEIMKEHTLAPDVTAAELDAVALSPFAEPGEPVFQRGAGSRDDGLETDDEFRTRIKAGDTRTPKFSDASMKIAALENEFQAAHGVGPGTEFPNLIAEPVTATSPDGTVTEGVGIARREPDVTISAPSVGAARAALAESYANQDMVESMLGKPDGEVRDATGKLVGGMWVNPVREKIREVAEAALAKLQADHGKVPMTRAGFDMLEKAIEAEGTFSIVAVEAAGPEYKTPEGHARIVVTTMSGGKEYEVMVP